MFRKTTPMIFLVIAMLVGCSQKQDPISTNTFSRPITSGSSSKSGSNSQQSDHGQADTEPPKPYLWADDDESILKFNLNMPSFFSSNNMPDIAKAKEIYKSISSVYLLDFLFISSDSIKSITHHYESFLPDNREGIAFTKLTKEWNNPIPGEVRLIDGLRFQFIRNDSPYSIVAFSRPLQHENIRKNIGIPLPWDESQEKPLGFGAKANIFQVEYSGRTFVVKVFKMQGIANEVSAYEKLLGVDGVGPYLGWVGGRISYSDLNALDIRLMLGPGTPMKEYLNHQPDKAQSFFSPLLSILNEMHNRHVWHSDIKTLNFIVINDRPHIIDFDNYIGHTWQLGHGHGFTSPYYEVGEMTGIKADIKAMGFSFFEMKYRKNDLWGAFKGDFLKTDLDPKQLASQLEKTGNHTDNVIAKMLKGEFKDANEALKFLASKKS